MKIGVIRFPGSNCYEDTINYFGRDICVEIWHMDKSISVVDMVNSIDLLIIPGGFAFGDRYYNNATEEYVISPGTMAVESPIVNVITMAVKYGKPRKLLELKI